MRSTALFLAPALSALLLTTACNGLKKLYQGGQRADLGAAEPAPVPASERQDLIGQWLMKPKEKDALVPNIVFTLRPDSGLTLSRDDSGGTNFTIQLRGTWTAFSTAPGLITLAFDYADVQPPRVCYPLPGGCQSYEIPFREEWAFTLTSPDTMETPGAVWHRAASLVADRAKSGLEAARSPAGPASASRSQGKSAKPGAGPASATRGFAVHLASTRTSVEVPAEWRRLAKLHPGVAKLSPQAPQVVAVPGKGVFYRVLGGAFPSRVEAQAACDRLRAEGQECAVVAL